MRFCIDKILPQQQQTTHWSGGTTTQLCIWPPEADYQKRDFVWRISSALVEQEQSVFTSLPQYHRILIPLNGALMLQHNESAPFMLERMHVHCFDGAWRTSSKGRIRDFNVMMRKGICQGQARSFVFQKAETISLDSGEKHRLQLVQNVVYCLAGHGHIIANEKSTAIEMGDVLLLQGSVAQITCNPLQELQLILVQLQMAKPCVPF